MVAVLPRVATAALTLVACAAGTVGTASAAKAHPVTLAQLQSAPVPSLCGHPAGHLVKGALPGLPAHKGKVVLAATAQHHGHNVLATGDLNGDGVADAAAVIECTTDSTARPASLQLYGSGGRRLGGFDLAAFTHRPTDVVASVTIVHRTIVVHWTANQRGDAPGHPTLDYAVDLTLHGSKVTASHAQSYKDFYVAEFLESYAYTGNRAAALKLATPHVVNQLLAANKKHSVGGVFDCVGAPSRDLWRGGTLTSFHLYGPSQPAWSKTDERYCVGLTDDPEIWTIVRMKHLSWRHWQADLFVQARSRI